MKSCNARRNRAIAALSSLSLLASILFFGVALVLPPGAGAALNGTIDTYVGGGNGDGDAAVNAAIDPRGMALVGPASAPDIYVADGKNNRVRRVDGDTGVIETIAGNGVVRTTTATAATRRTRRCVFRSTSRSTAPATSTSPTPSTTASARSAPIVASRPSPATAS